MRSKNEGQVFQNPFFSVIIPVYQSENTLERCINSVLSQDEQSYEIILVDDGSEDQSGRICDDYALRYPAVISVIHKKNEGPLFARIDGVNISCGRYLLFLDADDAYVPGMMKRLKTVLEAQNPDMVIFNYYRNFENGDLQLNRPLYANEQVFEGAGLAQLYAELISGVQLNSLWQKCVRREILPDMEELRRFGRMIIGEDKLFSMALVDKAQKIIYLADGLYNYHVVQKSVSRNRSLKHYQDMAIVYQQTIKYMSQWGLENYRIFCCLEKVEFGLSCLYSVVGEIRKGQKQFSDFKKVAAYIVEDREYWNAFSFCRGKMPFYKRAACQLLRCRHQYMVFALFYIKLLLRNVKDIIRN